ncbi:acetoin utilization protein AcuC [Cohnella thailandensis]|uniref:Acetoin utilization protein AcuC n=1 Tax=Cohnella thailandensis TaxID=557557 RepID=A0A841SWY4_9BACL|nr:acetoin utilization protein AcuC [Cohnella thailandensis]MBB6636424.1 acetoin utilization protein AcuC [Cohnella thailandensis]MBP1973605.1 acetoin utilization protein AcuC [Cohnella thailandensis]
MTLPASEALWIDCSNSKRYRFDEDHPFHPIRLRLTEELLEAIGALSERHLLKPSDAIPMEELEAVHRSDYLQIVQELSKEAPSREAVDQAARYGLEADGDTPCFPGMHEASAAVVQGSLAAAEAVMSGRSLHALHLGGGLHHAFPDRASGFCVYNDAAAAIRWMNRRYGAKVLYIDTDVHHGDGVQWCFYTDLDVFTFSIHETGKYLFPGTGFANERGANSGYGACLNVPLEPYTEDESWLACFSESLERIMRSFKPDVIVSQHGCDAHALDPLSHIHCSMNIYREIPKRIHRLAHEYTEGRWIALGGGGYEHWQVVPRAWALLWLEMTDHPLLRTIDASASGGPLPGDWPKLASPRRPSELPGNWLDDNASWAPMPRRSEITAKNKEVLEIALQHLG